MDNSSFFIFLRNKFNKMIEIRTSTSETETNEIGSNLKGYLYLSYEQRIDEASRSCQKLLTNNLLVQQWILA